MKRTLILTGSLVILLAANFIYGNIYLVPRDYDFEYIAKHCVILNQQQALNISDHITYDRAIDGGLYIFDHIPNETAPDDFEVAFRPITSELLCFPIVGCIVPPHLSEKCGA